MLRVLLSQILREAKTNECPDGAWYALEFAERSGCITGKEAKALRGWVFTWSV